MGTDGTGHAEGIRELHRDGRLAGEYPRVRGLLDGLDATDLARAGRLLARLDPGDVLREHPEVPVVTVGITGHGTLGPLVPALTAELARHGLLLCATVADLDSYVYELADPGSAVHSADPDLVLCVLDPAMVFDELPAPWGPEDVERVLDEKLSLLEDLAARFARIARGILVINTLPLPSHVTAQLLDYCSRARLGASWRDANARLLRLGGAQSSVIAVDLDPLIAEGIAATDLRLSVYARMHLSAGLLARYAREIGHLARHLAGRTKKCLAVDLDGTLWGGVLGDDGVSGIEVAGSYRGEAFQAFQKVVKQIASQGVLLAAVSKNDAELVRQVLREHPEILLREEDFVRVVANWRPKSDNLAELAGDLNLGVDCVTFVDDSRAECGLVRRELPGVAVVELGDDPALHVQSLLADGWFDVRALTSEDQARPARYRDDLVRRDFLDAFDSIEGYLAELRVRVRLARAGEPDVPRVSQLSLRTNQFNMTTRRLQPDDVRALLADAAASVLTVRSADRFGDNGLVGALILYRDADTLRIDNFLLSCRVFTRGIEQACLSAVLRHAAKTGVAAVSGTYRPTAKNGKVRDFYMRCGFTRVGAAAGAVEFRHDLRAIAAPPAHIQLAESLTASPGGPTP
jgi:FkbH-like protein